MKKLDGFREKLPRPLNCESVRFTLYARNGLYAAARAILRRRPRKRMALVPAYSCGDEIRPLITAGFKVKPYHINPRTLQLDLELLNRLIDRKTGMVLLTHYFGFPQQDICAVKKMCEENNVVLVEDCAHALGSVWQRKPLGTFGDVSVFSLRKFLPVPHGGAVVVNDRSLRLPKFVAPSSEAVAVDLSLFFLQRAGIFPPGSRGIETILRSTSRGYDRHGPRLEVFGGYRLSISDSAREMITAISSVESLLRHRRDSFALYLRFFHSCHSSTVRPLFSELPRGVIPLVFPLFVKNSEALYRKLRATQFMGVQPFWNFLHPMVDWRKFPAERKLKRGILALPVSKFLGVRALEQLLVMARQ